MLGSTQQVGADPVREARPHARAQGQDRLLDRHARPAHDPRRARDRRRDRGVARVLEAPEHVPRPAPEPDRRGRAPAHDDQPGGRRDRSAVDDEPEPAGDPDPHRARPRDPLRVHRRAGAQAALGRLLADRAADPRARLRRAEAARGVRARRGHPHGDRGRGARRRAGRADLGAALGREDDQLRDRLRDLVVRALREPRDPARGGAGSTSTRTSPASRTCRTSSSARSSRPSATATRRACWAGGGPCRSCAPQNRQTRSLGERLAVNFVMQGSNADIIKVAMVRIHDRLREEGRGARLVLQVHDELLLEVPDAEVSRGQGARPRRDVRRVRPRPAARRRRRHRRRLERGEKLNVELSDGVSLIVDEVGDGFPVIVLHGGPGLDHTLVSALPRSAR